MLKIQLLNSNIFVDIGIYTKTVMPSKKELKAISLMRLKEAKTLYNNQLYDGALYLSGYVIEIALKARICKLLDIDYPEKETSFKTHNFDLLVNLAGLRKTLDHKLGIDIDFKANWSIATAWKPEFRYKPIGASTPIQVQDVITALDDKKNGILTWIKKKW
jgi:hypothetical protein